MSPCARCGRAHDHAPGCSGPYIARPGERETHESDTFVLCSCKRGLVRIPGLWFGGNGTLENIRCDNPDCDITHTIQRYKEQESG